MCHFTPWDAVLRHPEPRCDAGSSHGWDTVPMEPSAENDAARWRLAESLDRADDRWQHGIGSGGYDMSDPHAYWLMLADALIEDGWLAARLADRDAALAVLARWQRHRDTLGEDATRMLDDFRAALHHPWLSDALRVIPPEKGD